MDGHMNGGGGDWIRPTSTANAVGNDIQSPVKAMTKHCARAASGGENDDCVVPRPSSVVVLA